MRQPMRTIPISAAIGLMASLVGVGAIQCSGKNDSDTSNSLGEAVYTINDSTPRCEPGTKLGRAGASNEEKTPSGISYMVKTPLNYNSSVAHPLLMVYAPAGRNRYESEKYVHLSYEATAAGFIVAYADHRTLSSETIEKLAEIPALIEKKWCMDKKRVFLTGHSDGGTAAMAIAFITGTKHVAAAIAPSAAGIRGEDLRAYQCPNPLPVMIMHSRQDTLFPGYGKETIQWWAACNGCDTANPVEDTDHCLAYQGCKNNVRTRYCEGTGTHSEWSNKNADIVEFFRTVNR